MALPLVLALQVIVGVIILVTFGPAVMSFSWALYTTGATQELAGAIGDVAGAAGAAARSGEKALDTERGEKGIGGVLVLAVGAVILLSLLPRR